MARLDKDAIADLLDKNPLADIIGRKVKLGRPNGKGVCDGPCLCEPQKGKSPLWVTPSHRWGCFKNTACGGDTFDYLRVHEGLEFRAAIERLGGAETVEADPTEVAEARALREEEAAARRRREAALAEDERRRAFAIWETGTSPEGTLVAAYFAHRRLTLPDTPSLRFAPDEVYWWTAGEKPQAIYSGPCMLAAIQGPDGRFAAVHRTWLDPRLGTPAMPPWGIGDGFASGKAQILAPDGSPAGNVKKMRGTKKGGAIRLTRPPPAGVKAPLLVGEGIETARTVHQSVEMHQPGLGWQAHVATDLGNIAGGAVGVSTPHPDRPGRRVPSPEPDLSDPGYMPPEWASFIVLLGDGDSDPLVTGALLERGRRRYEAAGFPAFIAMSAAGEDFNSMLMKRAA